MYTCYILDILYILYLQKTWSPYHHVQKLVLSNTLSAGSDYNRCRGPGGCLETIWILYIETSLVFNQAALFLQRLIKLKARCTSNKIVSIVTKISRLM